MVAGDVGVGNGTLMFNGYGVLIWDNKRVLDGGDGCPTMYLMPLKYA